MNPSPFSMPPFKAIMWKLIDEMNVKTTEEMMPIVEYYCPFMESCEGGIEELYSEIDHVKDLIVNSEIGQKLVIDIDHVIYDLGSDEQVLIDLACVIVESGKAKYDEFVSDPESCLPPKSDEYFELVDKITLTYWPKGNYSRLHKLLDDRMYYIEKEEYGYESP